MTETVGLAGRTHGRSTFSWQGTSDEDLRAGGCLPASIQALFRRSIRGMEASRPRAAGVLAGENSGGVQSGKRDDAEVTARGAADRAAANPHALRRFFGP